MIKIYRLVKWVYVYIKFDPFRLFEVGVFTPVQTVNYETGQVSSIKGKKKSKSNSKQSHINKIKAILAQTVRISWRNLVSMDGECIR